MRKTTRPSALLAAVCLLASPVTADMTLRIWDGPGSGPGGEFLIEPVSGFSFTPVSYGTYDPFQFETFCAEYNEVFYPGCLYHAELNTGTVFGGNGGDGSFDPLGERTAYVYSKFITGTLDNYAYDSGRPDSANALQDVIWYLENEITVDGHSYDPASPTNPWAEGTLRHDFFQDAVDHAVAGNFYNVRVLNLWKYYSGGVYSGAKQDQLVMIPAPGAALLGLIGLGSIARIRRRIA